MRPSRVELLPPAPNAERYAGESDEQYEARQRREAEQAEHRARQEAEALFRWRMDRITNMPIPPEIQRAICRGTLGDGGSDALAAVQDFMSADLEADFRPILVLAGRVGTGKTTACAWAMAHADDDSWGERNIVVRARNLAQLSRDHSDNYPVQNQFEDAPLVIVDDVGTEGRADALAAALYDLIDRRIHSCGKRTVLTSNLVPHRFCKHIGDRRVVDRLRQFARWHVVAQATSLRPGALPEPRT